MIHLSKNDNLNFITMEELKKQVETILNGCLANENAATELAEVLQKSDITTNEEYAHLILGAYQQGTNVFWDSYMKTQAEEKKLRDQVGKIKDRLYNDFIKGC